MHILDHFNRNDHFSVSQLASHFLRTRDGNHGDHKEKGDRESPREMPLLMETLPRLYDFDVHLYYAWIAFHAFGL